MNTPPPTDPPPPDEGIECPYRGLVPFEEDDWEFFFGRGGDIRTITSNLASTRLTVLYGASGVGKSSVLRAGVVRGFRLKAHENLAAGSPAGKIPAIISNWRDDPKETVQYCLGEAINAFPHGRGPLPPPAPTLVQTLALWSRHVESELLIIFDQFEEYFLYHPKKDNPFFWELINVARQSNLPVNFLVSMRDDSITKLDVFQDEIPVYDNCFRLDHLDRASAEDAIRKPVDRYNEKYASAGWRVEIDPSLVDLVLPAVEVDKIKVGGQGMGSVREAVAQDTHARGIEAPFLQMVMTRLWCADVRQGSGRLRAPTLAELGGPTRIISTHLDSAMKRLAPDEQRIAAQAFRHLVTPTGMKIAHRVEDLAEYLRHHDGTQTLSAEMIAAVMQRLSSMELRILRNVTPSEEPDRLRYEIFHDVLAAPVLDWQSRFHAEQKKELARAEERREAERKLRVQEAQQAHERAEADRALLEQRRKQEKAARELRALKRQRVVVSVVVLLAAILLGVFTTRYYSNLLNERDKRAQAIYDKSNGAAVAHLEGGKPNDVVVGLHGLARNIRADQTNWKAVALCADALRKDDWLRHLASGRSLGCPILAAAFTPDNRAVAVKADGSLLTYVQGAGAVDFSRTLPDFKADGKSVLTFAAFNADGSLLLLKSVAGTPPTLWKFHDGNYTKVASLPASPTPAYRNVVMDRAGEVLLLFPFSMGPATCEVFQRDGSEYVRRSEPALVNVVAAAISADDRRLATVSSAGQLQIWGAKSLAPEHRSDGEPLGFPLHSNNVWTLAFTADGGQLLTLGFQDKLRCWDIRTGQMAWEVEAPAGENMMRVVPAVAPAKPSLLAVSLAKTVALCDTAGWKGSLKWRKPAVEPACSRNAIMLPVLSADGQSMITLSGSVWTVNDTFSVWSIAPLAPSPSNPAAFSGKNPPAWLPDLADAVSELHESSEEDDPGARPNFSAIYEQHHNDPSTQSGDYAGLWQRFFAPAPTAPTAPAVSSTR